MAAPSLAHRDRKINLNYPLPVSNDPDEPIRQKWITETYQLLKWILPPRAVDTPEELAQLSQFVINIIDFRDPDCTMTHWMNPDVVLVPGQPANPSGNPPTPATAPTLALASSSPAERHPPGPVRDGVQPGRPQRGARVLVCVLPGQRLAGQPVLRRAGQHADAVVLRGPAAAGAGSTNPPDPSILDLGGFQYTAGDPYSGGCWDLVFTDDTPNSRPDPYRGELVQGGQFYALIPLNKDSFTATAAGRRPGAPTSPGSDVKLVPLGPAGVPAPTPGNPTANPPTPPTNFFYAFGNSPPNPAFETGTPSPTNVLSGRQRDRRQYAFAGAVPQPRGRPVQWVGDPEDHLVSGRAAGGRGGLRHSTGSRRPTISRSSPP